MTTSPNPRLTLLTFDLDNTLWSVHQVIGSAEAHMRSCLEEAVPGFNDHFNREMLGKIRAALLPQHPDIRHNLTLMRELVLRHALTDFGVEPARAATVAETATAAFLDGRHKVAYFPHALAVLKTLKQHYTLAALSNGNADIARLGLDRFFAFSCSAAEVGASKPAAPMFEQAMKKANAQPQTSVHIGDHPVDDIHGAAQLGMHTVLVELDGVEPHPDVKDQRGNASARITCLSELPEALARLP